MKYRRHFAQAPEGFFVFSKGLEKESELKAWEQHFFRKDIKTAIVQDEEGLYYLCREGKEYVDDERAARSHAKRQKEYKKRREYVTHLKGEKK